ncbi:ferric reductase-like protein like transmembrane component [Delphinella strobiligena]|nr:ferric reductase-like protein like transmembrane component [Delphinella strobiligena]
MDMGSMSSMGGDSSMTPLSPDGVDFSNSTQANDFLGDLLDDSMLQISGNTYARYFWYGVVVVIGIAGIVNVFSIATLKYRQREAAKVKPYPARPMNPLMRWAATITAISREASYPQLTPTKWPFLFYIPPIGTILLIVAYLAFVLALEFINNDLAGAQYNQALGIRAAWLAVAQVPLLILLVGKNNLIGLATGISYERLNILHRWVARMLFLLGTMHFGYQVYGWKQYNVFELELSDSCVPTGFATWVILLWLNLSTLAPFRNFSYEFFVVQHIITFFGFIIAVMYHLPSTALYSRVYIYIPIALYLVDRIIRTVRYALMNRTLSKATLTKLDGDVTRVQIHKPHLKQWTPGSHILVSFPIVGFGQSHHPATIASTPKSHNGDIVLLLKSKKGFTKQLMTHANDSSTALLCTEDAGVQKTHRVLVDGAYGGKQPDFSAFDSVCLIAGSTGITFTIPILLDLAERAERTQGRLPIRRLHVVWCLKQPSHARWVQAEQASAFATLRKCGIETEMSFYITCADGFTTKGEEKECPCACDKSLGPCCCINPEGDEEEALDILDEKKGSTIQTSATPVDSEATPSPTTTKAVVNSGRPDLPDLVEKLLQSANGESAFAVCGPLGLSKGVRNAVASASDRRAVHKGTGAQGVFLHVEGFGL